MRATRFLGLLLLAGCSNLAKVLPDAPIGEPPARPPEALAQARAGGARPPESFELPCGLKVVLLAEPREPRVALELRFATGRRDEGQSTAGASAAFARRAAEPDEGSLAQQLELGGAWVIAQAGPDDTRLVALAPRALLPELLALAAEELLAPDPSPLEPPEPDARADDEGERLLWTALHPGEHPYHALRNPQPRAADPSALARFQHERFVAADARLVLAGGFEPQEARAALQRVFEALPLQPPPGRRSAPPPRLSAPLRLELGSADEQARLTLAWNSPATGAPGHVELELAAALLCEGPEARLVQRLVLDSRLAEEVVASQQDAELGSLFRIDALAAPGTDLAAVEHEILDTLEQLARHGPTREELARARTRAQARHELRHESLLARVRAAQDHLGVHGTPDGLRREPWSASTAVDVGAEVQALLRAPHVTLMRLARE